jgi:hypothetical protein
VPEMKSVDGQALGKVVVIPFLQGL